MRVSDTNFLYFGGTDGQGEAHLDLRGSAVLKPSVVETPGAAFKRHMVFAIPDVDIRNVRAQLAVKRAIDVIFAAAGLIAILPFLLVVAIMIRLDSKGPVLFRQQRIGLDGKPFGILKFRTMHSDRCDVTGVAQTSNGDPRITRVGRVLRKTNFDELPQLWNIVIGDMSLVGPRPHVPGMLAAGVPYEELVNGYDGRHKMRPGLTGLAQSRGLRGPTDKRWKAIHRVVCDIEYIRTFSLVLDAKIILRTVWNEVRGGTGF